METWLSDKRPLLSLVFTYLELHDVQRWRLAGTFGCEYSDAHVSPQKWRDIVRTHPSIVQCPICPQVRQLSKMFHCTTCCLLTCGSHVMSCNTCMADMCNVCARGYRHSCAIFDGSF